MLATARSRRLRMVRAVTPWRAATAVADPPCTRSRTSCSSLAATPRVRASRITSANCSNAVTVVGRRRLLVEVLDRHDGIGRRPSAQRLTERLERCIGDQRRRHVVRPCARVVPVDRDPRRRHAQFRGVDVIVMAAITGAERDEAGQQPLDDDPTCELVVPGDLDELTEHGVGVSIVDRIRQGVRRGSGPAPGRDGPVDRHDRLGDSDARMIWSRSVRASSVRARVPGSRPTRQERARASSEGRRRRCSHSLLSCVREGVLVRRSVHGRHHPRTPSPADSQRRPAAADGVHRLGHRAHRPVVPRSQHQVRADFGPSAPTSVRSSALGDGPPTFGV